MSCFGMQSRERGDFLENINSSVHIFLEASSRLELLPRNTV